jgi:hypothetical protein
MQQLTTALLAAAFATCLFPSVTLAQAVEWMVPISGPSVQQGLEVAVDSAGNVFACGAAYGDVDLHPGSADSLLTYPGSVQDHYLAKYTPDGSLLWGAVLGGEATDILWCVVADAQGNVYAGGTTGGGYDVDPGPDTLDLPLTGLCGLLLKFDPNGGLLWAHILPNGSCDITHLATTATGGVICMGTFEDTLDADPGPDSTLLISAGAKDVFLGSYNGNGEPLWVAHFGSTHPDQGKGLRLADNGDVIMAMNFDHPMDVDPGPDTLLFNNTTAQDDIALIRLDPSGQLVWADHIHGSSYAETSRALALDANGDITLAGWFCFTTDLDPGPGVHQVTSSGSCDAFIARYDGNGAFLSAFTFGEVGNPTVLDMEVRSDGLIMLAGHLPTPADLDPGPGQFLLTPDSTASGFAAFYMPDGTLITADLMGNGIVHGTAVDHQDAFLLTGNSSGTSDLGPGPSTYLHTAQGAQDAYMVKLQVDVATGSARPVAATARIRVAPNPTGDLLSVDLSGAGVRCWVIDVAGRVHRDLRLPEGASYIDVRDLASGTYALRLATGEVLRFVRK